MFHIGKKNFSCYVHAERQLKNPGAEDPALISPHRGVINIPLHLVGILEYWEKHGLQQLSKKIYHDPIQKDIVLDNPLFYLLCYGSFHPDGVFG